MPTYMIKGDKKRGIKLMAPELKKVEELKKYCKLFKDPEEPDKGRFYNAIASWQVTKKNTRRLKAYGLDKYVTNFIPGSDAALSGSMAAAYKRGKPWLGYYCSPTWALGMYDMTPPPQRAALCPQGGKGNRPLRAAQRQDQHPGLVGPGQDGPGCGGASRKNTRPPWRSKNKFLAHMREPKGDFQAGAMFFLKSTRTGGPNG